MRKLARISPHQQKTQSNCSAACLHVVLRHHGLDVPEELLAQLIGVEEGRGAELFQIVGAARALKFEAKQAEIHLPAAIALVKGGFPIICDVQSWNFPGKGHYCVLAEIHGDMAEIMDPNVDGNWRNMSIYDFAERWWDYEMYPPHRKMLHAGVLITP